VHQIALVVNGIHLLENLKLDELSAKQVYEFAFIMQPLKALVHPEMDQEEVARTFQKYHLASAPVVDDAGRLTGMVTVDDIVDVIQEESEEDLLKLSGVSEASQSDTLPRSVRARAPWLLINLCTELTASIVIAFYQDSINRLVALAVIMPIVSSVGGNAGTQALAVCVAAGEALAQRAAEVFARASALKPSKLTDSSSTQSTRGRCAAPSDKRWEVRQGRTGPQTWRRVARDAN
jgi:Mg/Co/Ni transporter MgtE